MSNIHIKFSQIDEYSGAIFVQFATDESLHMIDQQTMHAIFPRQYGSDDLEKIMPEIAKFGAQMLIQQNETQKNQFSREQVEDYQKYLGSIRSVSLENGPAASLGMKSMEYNIDSSANINANVDEVRNIVLEILAEEGLIPGGLR
ncbi:hypothetical protein [Methylophilus methylotrophus]|uniref:hypothetical protein n=1 Tax=Methylophilus methylotrophus TaxID=17 RepID=UPI000F5AFAC9|nr:hypothetical protein [Methylophilus methylotrophus]